MTQDRKIYQTIYTDESDEKHFTLGKTPNRALFNAFTSLKDAIIKEAERRFGSL